LINGIPTDVNVEIVQPILDCVIEAELNAIVHTTALELANEFPLIPEAVPPVVVKKCPAGDLIDSMDDAEESDMDDDEEVESDGRH
jgi:hypothetical protein